eukprot:72674-Chlamydomonas_euryale.AAC.1
MHEEDNVAAAGPRDAVHGKHVAVGCRHGVLLERVACQPDHVGRTRDLAQALAHQLCAREARGAAQQVRAASGGGGGKAAKHVAAAVARVVDTQGPRRCVAACKRHEPRHAARARQPRR